MKSTCFRISSTAACLGLALGASAAAQTAYPEVEPNNAKTEATIVHCIHSSDWLTGTTTGTATSSGSTANDTVDMFRISTCALPLGIYRHQLFITSTTPGHTATLRGRDQTDGVFGALDVAVQSSSPGTVPTRFNQWYGFGRSEEMYYRIEGTPTTTAPYSVVLASSIVTPLNFPAYVTEGSVTFSTVGSGHTTNTDLWVYDSAFEPLFTFGNDDAPIGRTYQSTLTRTMTAGTYYLAIANYNLASDQASPADDGNRNGNVFDFPGAVASSSMATGVDLTFSIADFQNTTPMALAANSPYEVKWVRFVVIPHGYSMHSFCAGDGHAGSTPCPCGNNGSSNGHGCAGLPNAAGAYLDATGIPSYAGDTVLLHGQDMPPNSICLFFQGSVLVNGGFGVPFNDGLVCAGGTQVRLGTRQVDPQGDAVFGFGEPGDPLLHVAGGVGPAGGAFVYQAWYRNPNGPCGYRSNTSNGLLINWGN